MPLLWIMDSRTRSNDIETKRRRNRDNRRSNKRKLNMKEPTQQNTYNKNKKMVITTIVVKISVGEAKLF